MKLYNEPSSFIDLIPHQYHGDIIPKLRHGKKGTAAVKTLVELVVNEVAPLLMWKVYFGVGHPYWLPELRQTAFQALSETFTSMTRHVACSFTVTITKTSRRTSFLRRILVLFHYSAKTDAVLGSRS